MRLVALLIAAAVVPGAVFGQAIQGGGSPTVTPNQTSVTTSWLYLNKMRYQGAWSSSTTYSGQDVVTYGGATYISLAVLNLNNTPSSSPLWWANVAANASAPGSNTQIIYNSSGALAGSAGLTWNGSVLNVAGNATAVHLLGGGSAPTLTSGGGGTIAGTDLAGRITLSGTTSPVVITFATAWTHAPVCMPNDENITAYLFTATTTTTLTITNSPPRGLSSGAWMIGDVIDWTCAGY